MRTFLVLSSKLYRRRRLPLLYFSQFPCVFEEDILVRLWDPLKDNNVIGVSLLIF